MKTRLARYALMALFVIATLTTVPAALAADAQGTFSKNLTVTGTAEVDVSTGSGNISVQTGTAGAVSIRATIQANDRWFNNEGLSAAEKVKRIEANPPVEQRGNIIVIGKIDDPALRNHVSISYEITLPVDTKLRAQSGSGDINIAGINGTLRAGTGSGNVTAKQLGDEARVSTGSGDVRLDNVKGRVYASTGSGNVQAYAVSGGFYGQTGSGDITFEQNTAGDVTVKTGSGNLRLKNVKGGLDAHTGSGEIDVDGEAKGDWNVRAGSGNITLRLPQNSVFTVDARSSSGEVSVNHPVTIQGTVKRNRLQGKVGAGGVLLSLESGSGNIRIE